jgi:quinol monooxygenase YgiN
MPDHSPGHTADPGNIILNGHIDVPPERLDAVAAALPDHIALTRAEPGCLFFDVRPCPDVAGRFLVSERFTDQAAFDAHQARAKASPWAEVTDGIPRDYQITVAG